MAQSNRGVSYAAKLEKSEAELDWNQATATLERKVRAFDPWPVAWCTIAAERTRIWKVCTLAASTDHKPGSIVSATANGIDISTADGQLRLLRLQRPGGRQISAAEYLNARKSALVPRQEA